MTLPELLVGAGTMWLVVGALVALIFLGYAVDRLLDDARDVYLFRVLVAPGVILLWPIVLWQWRRRANSSIEWQSHHEPRRKLAGILEVAMAAMLIVILGLAITIGKPPNTLPDPVKIGVVSPDKRILA